MSDAPASLSARFGHILARIAEPFLLFSGFLALTMILSWMLLLPHWVEVRIDDIAFSPRELTRERIRLTSSITVLKEKRNMSVLPVHDQRYLALQKQKQLQMSAFDLMQQVQHLAQSFQGNAEVVVLDSMVYDAQKHIVVLRGDVRNSGFSSMTVLAQFADQLQKLSGVTSVDLPGFDRKTDTERGIYSPFTFTLHLS
jgi:hypothetical protein